MKRIMVIGVSAGAGKSTFAQKLGKALGIRVYHLDTLYWKPGWIEASLEEFSTKQKEIVNKEKWIIEGTYTSTFHIRTEKCDTVIYLELPLFVCLYRVVKRWISNIGKTRPDMGKGCKEKLDWKFIKFILTTYHSRKRKMADILWDLEKSGKTVIALKSKREINRYLNHIERQ
ncbi:MAG: topology modulation protein [Bacillaceae bacterium]|nr:topology modulation protein [Bacillaceae bacterium]